MHVPAPEGWAFDETGFVLSDSDIACYCRPEHGNHILVGSEDPPCDDHIWVDDDTDYNATSPTSGRRKRSAMVSGCRAWVSRAG